jgi:hypothetical protein
MFQEFQPIGGVAAIIDYAPEVVGVEILVRGFRGVCGLRGKMIWKNFGFFPRNPFVPRDPRTSFFIPSGFRV